VIKHIVDDIKSNSFRLDILLSFIVGSFWLKVFFNLRLTRTFGPMIKIILVIVGEMLTFIAIWFI
jgi:hypothetical protein